MADNFQGVLYKRNDLLHRWSIRKELYQHLEKFINTDVRQAELGIKTDGEGLVVPQDLIVELRENILADMAEIMVQVKQLDQREVAAYDYEEEDDEGGEGEEGEADREEDSDPGSEEG
jgi:hypothetical protein